MASFSGRPPGALGRQGPPQSEAGCADRRPCVLQAGRSPRPTWQKIAPRPRRCGWWEGEVWGRDPEGARLKVGGVGGVLCAGHSAARMDRTGGPTGGTQSL